MGLPKFRTRATLRGTALAAVAVLAASVPGLSAAAPPAPSDPPVTSGVDPTPGPVVATSTVTLLTGDVVTTTTHASGEHTFTVEPAARPAGQPVTFSSGGTDDEIYVIPSDAEPYLAAGALDRALFNVALLKDYDGDLPIIVEYADSTSSQRTTAALPGAAPVRQLESIGATAMSVDPGSAARFWDTIDPDGPAGPTTMALERQVEKVWLDRAVHATLDESVPQIGAPVAHEAGFDGTGVTVAVLDSGIDTDHPDLVGKVAASANFSRSSTTEDLLGHGTHVASTIAGSGAASDGRYRGVAPGATLLNGKVLDDNGFGSSSGLIDGLEWAAANGADVINFSLSSDTPSDGTGPMGQAVNRITEQTGALVVAAAGNRFVKHTVYAPAAAREALAVGAVDKSDRLANFSSEGPGLAIAEVKPQITAPGVDIVAARAEGTNLPGSFPVGEHYTGLDGTSMATPHVSGAAALLAQANPDWAAPELRRAMVSTAESGKGLQWFEQGTGRVDVARALTQGVYATGTLNFGVFEPPHDDLPPVARSVTFTNTTDADVTLDLTEDMRAYGGAPAPEDALVLGTDQVTVPASGQADVPVTVDPAAADTGTYGGYVEATSSDGTVTLRTAVSWRNSVPMSDLTIRLRTSTGELTSGQSLVWVARVDETNPNNPFADDSFTVEAIGGVANVQVPHGTYMVSEAISELRLDVRRTTIATDAEVEVTGESTEVVLDARDGVALRPEMPEQTEQGPVHVMQARHGPEGSRFTLTTFTGSARTDFYATPVGPVEYGTYSVYDQWAMQSLLLETRARPGGPRLHPEYQSLLAAPKIADLDDRTLPVVWAGAGTAADFASVDVRGAVALVGLPEPALSDPSDQAREAYDLAEAATARAAEAGARAVMIYVDSPGAIALTNLPSDPILELALSHEEGDALRGWVERRSRRDGGHGRHHEAWISVDGRISAERVYELHYVHPGGVQPDHRHQVDPSELARFDVEFHSDVPRLVDKDTWHTLSDAHDSSFRIVRAFWVPADQTFIVGELGDHYLWNRLFRQGIEPGGSSLVTLRSFDQFLPGERPEDEHWFATPLRTSAAERPPYAQLTFCSACRENDVFVPPATDVGGSDLSHASRRNGNGNSTYRMFSNGRELPAGRWGSLPVFPMSPDPATYRLDLTTTQREVPDVRRLATEVRTSWTFRSGRPEVGQMPDQYLCRISRSDRCAFQSLILLRYDLGALNLRNQARAGLPFMFEIEAAPHQGTPDPSRVARMRVWTSTDDGSTWQRAFVWHRWWDDTFRVLTWHPSLEHTSGFVSLKVEAWDREGNSVTQTIDRAYALRGWR